MRKPARLLRRRAAHAANPSARPAAHAARRRRTHRKARATRHPLVGALCVLARRRRCRHQARASARLQRCNARKRAARRLRTARERQRIGQHSCLQLHCSARGRHGRATDGNGRTHASRTQQLRGYRKRTERARNGKWLGSNKRPPHPLQRRCAVRSRLRVWGRGPSAAARPQGDESQTCQAQDRCALALHCCVLLAADATTQAEQLLEAAEEKIAEQDYDAGAPRTLLPAKERA